MRIYLTNCLLAIVAICGCTSGDFGAGLGVATGDAPANKDEPRKPSDESETIPGYLTDPKQIHILDEDDDKRVILGQKGAIASESGPVESVQIRIGILTKEQWETFTSTLAEQESGTVTAMHVVTASPQENGSFYADVDTSLTGPLVISAYGTNDGKIFSWSNQETPIRTAFAAYGESYFVAARDRKESEENIDADEGAQSDEEKDTDNPINPSTDQDDCAAGSEQILDGAESLEDFPGSCTQDTDCEAIPLIDQTGCDTHVYGSKTSPFANSTMSLLKFMQSQWKFICGNTEPSCPAAWSNHSLGSSVRCDVTSKRCVSSP